MALVADCQKVALAHVAESSCNTYIGHWNLFVAWCNALAVPRVTLPTTDGTVALYLQSVVNRAKTFAPVKSSSAAIAFYQKINLFQHEPTQYPAVCIVRSAAMRRFSSTPRTEKNPSNGSKLLSLRRPTGPNSRVTTTG